MVDYVLRRNRRQKMDTEERSKLLERIARQTPEPEVEPEPQPQPEAAEPDPLPAAAPQIDPWSTLPTIPVNERLLDEHLIITATRHDPAHATFDVLRTRLVQTLSEKGWSRVGITSPTQDCGKSFVSMNLAIALSRYENCRTVLLDMDLRKPSLADLVGVHEAGSMGDFLRGDREVNEQFHRFAENNLKIGNQLAIGLNDRIEPYAAELLARETTHLRIEEMEDELTPDVVLYDLPPALAQDDVIAFRQMYDGVLIVAGGGQTTSAEIREVMRRLGDDVPLLGVVLNKADNAPTQQYSY
ncbi:CpsD/CapB family tyrosine-protein kinase [Thalassovita sp.]|jgi:Mrp family chromosome partitioning ATPase|uniref:CpsD/CapB family tyrosine-protein kinase n=1 Tax=Thalassovita sp. TaxID=1979401 RepID=UPI003B5985FF